MILIPTISAFHGVTVAVPLSTIAQLLSNLSRVVIGFKKIHWKNAAGFLLLAAPLTALGAYTFVAVPKVPMTRILCLFLILFAILKISGKIKLPPNGATVIVGGGVTGAVNGLLGISGPLSSAVFLTLGMTPVAYIATEATAATVMHIIKIIVYEKLNIVDTQILLRGLAIGCAMMVGNLIAMKTIKRIDKKFYQKIVAAVMILASIWLFFTVKG